jgi:hypothetical protein
MHQLLYSGNQWTGNLVGPKISLHMLEKKKKKKKLYTYIYIYIYPTHAGNQTLFIYSISSQFADKAIWDKALLMISNSVFNCARGQIESYFIV